MESGFVHLHLHTEYSLLDGACRIKKLPEAVKKLGQTAVAITDHGVMYGAVDFFSECTKNDIKPIIGCEIYVAPKSRFDKEKRNDNQYYHLVLLCKNEEGYKNLIKLVSRAYTEGFYSKPRADIELLKEYSGGLIALSACLGGAVPQFILNDDIAKATEYAILLNEIFGSGNFYLELQSHGLEGQEKVNASLAAISEKTGIPLVATNDVHYIEKSDAESQAVLMCIQTNTQMNEGKPIGFETDEFYLKSTEEMEKLFGKYKDALSNTVKIADECNFKFDFSKLFLPAFDVPKGETSEQYLERLCFEGLQKRISQYLQNGEQINRTEYEERIRYELSVITKMGYSEYYLIVMDFVNYAKSIDIPVGPGRGSGAGSLAAYCLGITDVDSIKYNLLFERFLNPERVSMPDFDIDFCDERRGEVIDYVARKYGRDHVAQIVTFGTMAARAAIRDVGRALGIPYADVDVVAKLVPNALNITLDKALEDSSQLREIYKNDPKLRNLIDVAKSLEGMPRHASTHAAGVVITDKPVSEYVPLSLNRDSVVTQYTMNNIADLGLLKIDFLGLKYLTIIDHAEKQVRKKIPDFDITKIPLDDKETYALLSRGETEGIFQLESAGMRNLIVRLSPKNIEDITAAISLYRPGPMDSIPKYLENRRNPQKIKYISKKLEEILSVTNGCIIYQEQVMQIFRSLAGYSYGAADIVRRAMSKKKKAVMEKEREYFIYGKKKDDGTIECDGAIKRGLSEGDAEKLYSEMAGFAQYAFNKSHAASYAFISYRTAYLKCHFPQEYLSSLLTNYLESTGKVNAYINECARLGLKVMPPDINESSLGFTASGKNLRFGFLAVKNVGESFINELIAERETNGKYKSFEDFMLRVSSFCANKRMLESLIKCGAFDSFGKKRSQLLYVYDKTLDALARRSKAQLTGQLDFFSPQNDEEESDSLIIDYPDLPEFTAKEILAMEREMAGLYFSGHPLYDYTEAAKFLKAVTTEDIYSSFGEEPSGYIKEKQVVILVGIVRSKKLKITKNDARMAFVDFEDLYGSIELIVFPKVLEEFNSLLTQDGIVAISGEVSVKETMADDGEESKEEPKILLKTVFPIQPNKNKSIKEEAISNKASNISADRTQNKEVSSLSKKETRKTESLYLKVKSDSDEGFLKAKNLLEIFGGKTPVYVYFEDKAKLTKANGLEADINGTMIKLLKEYLSDKNVVLK